MRNCISERERERARNREWERESEREREKERERAKERRILCSWVKNDWEVTSVTRSTAQWNIILSNGGIISQKAWRASALALVCLHHYHMTVCHISFDGVIRVCGFATHFVVVDLFFIFIRTVLLATAAGCSFNEFLLRYHKNLSSFVVGGFFLFSNVIFFHFYFLHFLLLFLSSSMLFLLRRIHISVSDDSFFFIRCRLSRSYHFFPLLFVLPFSYLCFHLFTFS